MKTINLKEESPSVAQLLAMARKKSVLLVSKDGATFILEEADEFDKEVSKFGGSEKFIRFLAKRCKEPAVTSIDEFAQQLIQETQNNTLQPPSRPPRKSKSRRNHRAARG